MFGSMIKFELKNVIREQMTIVMLIYPFVFGLLGRALIHFEVVYGQGVELTAILISLLAGFSFGAMGGFSLLDDRDDQVLSSIQITPVPVQWYIWFKVCFAYILAVFAGFFVIWVVGAFDLSPGRILLVSALSALQAPVVMFIINAFSENKVEGFVAMKGSGFLLIFPVVSFFFLDAVEWVFAIAPAHWPAKALQYAMMEPAIEMGLAEMNLGFSGYVGIGFAYNLLLVAATYILFKRKNLL